MRKHEKVSVELLHEHGLNISYDKVQEIPAQLGDAAVSRYQVEGLVCYPVLRKKKTFYNSDHAQHRPLFNIDYGNHFLSWYKRLAFPISDIR